MSALYDEITESFVQKKLATTGPAEYLYSSGETKYINVSLKEEVVLRIKTLAVRDAVPENRVIYTAVMHFAKNSLTNN